MDARQSLVSILHIASTAQRRRRRRQKKIAKDDGAAAKETAKYEPGCCCRNEHDTSSFFLSVPICVLLWVCHVVQHPERSMHTGTCLPQCHQFSVSSGRMHDQGVWWRRGVGQNAPGSRRKLLLGSPRWFFSRGWFGDAPPIACVIRSRS
jgi:hypothetical protein